MSGISEALFYTDSQVDLIIKEMPNIEKRAKKCENEMVYPTIHDFNNAMNHVIKYIKDHKKIVYGGFALNELFKDKNPSDAIYDGTGKDDIEIYSPKPLHDLKNICDMLHEKGFKEVVGREAQHMGSYTVFVEFEKYCDIQYVPTFIHNAIKTLQTKSGLTVADPSFIKIDYYRMFNNPLTGFHKIECRFKRYALLQKYYPFQIFEYTNRLPEPSHEVKKIIHEINSQIKNKDTLIISGFKAYNVFIKSTESYSKKLDSQHFLTEVPFIDLVSTNYVIDCAELINHLKKKYSNVEYIEYYPFHEFYGNRTEIKVNGNTVAYIYDHFKKCIPYLETNKDIKIVTFTYLLMNLIILQFRAFVEKRSAYINKDQKLLKEKEFYYFFYGQLVSNLITVRNSYFKLSKKTPLDETAFKEFGTKCIGETITAARIERLKIKARMSGKKKKAPTWYYHPVSELSDKFSFPNTSGNVITNKLKLKINTLDIEELKKQQESLTELSDIEENEQGDEENNKEIVDDKDDKDDKYDLDK